MILESPKIIYISLRILKESMAHAVDSRELEVWKSTVKVVLDSK